MIALPPIRVLLVDDSAIALAVLQKMLSTSPDIQVVGTAINGKEALSLIPTLQPQVICADYHMPVMDGLELTKQVMERYPRPILVVSSTISGADSYKAFPLLEAGAVDVFPKPTGALSADGEAAQQLVSKIRILSGVVVFPRRPKPALEALSALAASRRQTPVVSSTEPVTAASRVVAIVSSTGGPTVLQEILTALPGNYPLPVLCVQHISPGFLEGLMGWLNNLCEVEVRTAIHRETPEPGVVYFSGEDTHLEVDRRGKLAVTHDPPVDGHRPSATLLLNSVAQYYGSSAIGIILSGMGSDGAIGLHALSRSGGFTIAQDEASCVVFGMPKVAIELGAVRHVLTPAEIARKLVKIGKEVRK